MSNYPGSVTAYTTKLAGDTIQAAHVNDLQSEVTAIETALLNGFEHVVWPNTNDTYDLGKTATRWRNLYLSGTLDSSLVGSHALSGAGTGAQTLLLRNSTAGTGNFATLNLTTDVSPQGALRAHSSTFTTAAPNFASGITLSSAGSGGLALAATHASGTIKLYAAGSTLLAELTSTALRRYGTAGQAALIVDGTADYAECHIRPASGKKGYLTFTEDSVADRWALGTENGDSTLYLRTGGVTGTTRMTVSTGGIVTGSGQLRCIAYKSSAQEITSGAGYTSVTWDSETVDTGGLHDPGSNPQRFTIPTGGDGAYLMIGTVLWEADAGAAGTRGLQIQKNGTTQLESTDIKPGTAAIAQQVVAIANLVATDYVQLNAKQDSGGGLDVVEGATFSKFMIVKLW